MDWRGKKVKLAELKGNYVLLDFWGYWCQPCVQSMPVLIELHEKFADKGLAIIAMHMDQAGEVDSAAKLDEKIAAFKTQQWKGKDLPFPVALTSGKEARTENPKTEGPKTAAQTAKTDGAVRRYGINSFPTTILIDRDGKVVGRFDAHDIKAATARIEKLLDEKK